MSPQLVQTLAFVVDSDIKEALEVGDDVRIPLLEHFAKLGAFGKYPGNMHRDIVTALPAHGVPELDMLSLYTKQAPGTPNILTNPSYSLPP